MKKDRGAVSTEFVILLPLLITVLFGGLFLSIAVADSNTLQSVAASGAKMASYEGGDNQEVREHIAHALNSRLLVLPTERVTVNITVTRLGETITTSHPANQAANVAAGIYADHRSSITVELVTIDYNIPFVTTTPLQLTGEAVVRNAVP